MAKKAIKIGAVLIGIILVLFLLNYFVKQNIKNRLDNYFTQYEDLDVNIYTNKLALTKPLFEYENWKVDAAAVQLKDFNYYKYFINNKIAIDRVKIENPHAVYFKNKKDTSKAVAGLDNEILIHDLDVTDGEFAKKPSENAANNLFLAWSDLHLKDLKIDSTTLNQKIPFDFKEYVLLGDSLFVDIDGNHHLVTNKINLRDGEVLSENLKILAKYGREEFQEHIPFEKDRYILTVERIKLNSLDFTTVNDSLKLTNPLMTIENAYFEIYRDRTRPDNPRVKTLYSQKLRRLPIKIDFETIEVQNSSISYLEKAKNAGIAEIHFNSIDGKIENLSNLNLNQRDSKKTRLSATASFMGAAPLTFNYSFDPANLEEGFDVSGDLDAMDLSQVNPFVEPIRNTEVKGRLEDFHFNLSGNENVATGDITIQYHDLQILPQEQDEEDKKEIFSFFANLVADQKVMTEENHIENITVHRNKHKTFWNYLWSFLKKGIREAIL